MTRVTPFFVFLLLFTSCFEQDEFPDTPSITFEEIVFLDNNISADSLVIEFSFQDGNGDIGLSNASDLLPPYHIYDFIIDSEDSVISISRDISDAELPLYRAPVFIEEQNGNLTYVYLTQQREFFSETDNRPQYSCDSYEIIESDTIYISRNELYFNFHIAFEKKVGDDYLPVNFRQIFNSQDCDLGNFNSRIPIFDADGQVGTIKYAMLSQGFSLAFLDDLIRARFYIYDRAGNKSNEVVTPDFILTDITQ